MTRAAFPLPEPDHAPTRPFWEAAARGELAIPRCPACATWVWYPRDPCPACRGAAPVWTPVSGRGTLFAWTVVRHAFARPFAPLVPYATGLVALAEDPGVRLATLLVDCDPAALRADQPVRVVFRPLPYPDSRVPAPLWTPA
jgi:uncharacterized OB-fold protein